MKALKITLFVALLFATLVSCTKQDLNEDDVLRADNHTDMPAPPFTGGEIDD
ncbi:hypothetical protein [Flavivirga spongiicola]|uniref:Uncharacterized protein n=1 Tax=Flavivirga spongiicola TaxID=421621 RepID=A0ABU7XXH7_9FLAO|nr:hypothetical protein [Flavivirga sp. MEBiC05379]MDO5979651.1 hypothetical protein [Flavivirga sp. MEBiC05379]